MLSVIRKVGLRVMNGSFTVVNTAVNPGLHLSSILNPLASQAQRTITTRLIPFEQKNGAIAAYHYVIQAEPTDTKESVEKGIKRALRPNSAVIFDNPSKLTRYDDARGRYVPVAEGDFTEDEVALMLQSGREKPGAFSVSAGHTFMGLTDEQGEIVTGIGFNPAEITRSGVIVPTRTHLHPQFFHNSQFNSAISKGRVLTAQEEIDILIKKMLISHTIVPSITVIPVTPEQQARLKDNLQKIFSEEMFKVYNLCTGWVNENDIEQIEENDLFAAVCQLVEDAKKIPGLENMEEQDGKVIACALACTNALSAAFFGDPHYLARKHGPDMATSVAAALCAAELVGPDFFKFASRMMSHSAVQTYQTSPKPGKHF